ncbi:hypothetical protein HN873_026384 [Arachis hypogaea]
MSTSRPTRNSDAPAPVSASTGHAAGTAARLAAAVRATRIDPRWKYVSVVEEGNTNDTILRLKSFQEMLWAIGSFGPNLPAPTYHALRVPLINEELEYTKDLLKGHKEQ